MNDNYSRARAYILIEYETVPDATIENLNQVRAIYDAQEERWEIHLVCTEQVETPDSPGDETAGIDLGICNFAAVSYSSEDAELYPGNRIKEDGYYFPKKIARCDNSPGGEVLRLHRRWSERRTHFLHSLAKHIVERYIEKKVGQINVGDLGGIREDKNRKSKNWVRHGNLDLHGWAFDRFTSILEYKAKVSGVEVVRVSERDTSKTCCVCQKEDESQRVERGLYVCESCDAAFNGDVNGAENIRIGIAERESNFESESEFSLDKRRSNGWLAQPEVYLHELSSGFQPQAQVVDSKP